MGLGSVDEVSLATARDEAGRLRELVRQKIDPLEARQQALEERRKEAAENITFAQATDEFFVMYEKSWKNAKHRGQWRSTLEKYAFPRLGNRPVKPTPMAWFDPFQTFPRVIRTQNHDFCAVAHIPPSKGLR